MEEVKKRQRAGYVCPVIITPDEFLAKKEAFGL